MQREWTEWEVCFVSSLEFEAEIVRGYLDSHRIPCQVRNERFRMEPLTFGALGQVRLLVPPEWGDVARGLIRGRLRDAERKRSSPGRVAQTEER